MCKIISNVTIVSSTLRDDHQNTFSHALKHIAILYVVATIASCHCCQLLQNCIFKNAP